MEGPEKYTPGEILHAILHPFIALFAAITLHRWCEHCEKFHWVHVKMWVSSNLYGWEWACSLGMNERRKPIDEGE